MSFKLHSWPKSIAQPYALNAGRKDARHIPDTPPYSALPVIGVGFDSYITVIRCLICGWRAYEAPWPRECGKCLSLNVTLERATTEPIEDEVGRKLVSLRPTQRTPAQALSALLRRQKTEP